MKQREKDVMSKQIDRRISELYRLGQAFFISGPETMTFIENFHSEMDKGLSGEPSSLKMLPAFVGPPTGREVGEFLAIDCGGTNFRVLSVRLLGGGEITKPRIQNFCIPDAILNSSQKDFFGFIADAVLLFQRKYITDQSNEQELGFTFSFPMEQTSVNSGKLILWTKGFAISGVVGEDVVSLLEQALAGKGITNLKVVCLANDTVGTLATMRYVDRDCDIGVILGTGTNGAYVEKMANIKKLGYSGTDSGEMIINVEWGEFNKFRQTDYDRLLDAYSNNAGHAFLEKMVSAKYLNELARLIIADFIRKGLFSDSVKEAVAAFDAFSSEHLSTIANDCSHMLYRTKEILIRLGVDGSTADDRVILKKVCQIVYERSMEIAAIAIASLILKIDPELEREHVVAVDGSLFEKAEGYRDGMLKNLNQILGEGSCKVRLELSKDGSGIGAAIIAATASPWTIL